MIFLFSLSQAVLSILAQTAAALSINGWWVIVIFVSLVVVISLLILGNRQERVIPTVGGHGHENHDRHQSVVVETEQVQKSEIPQLDDLTKIEGIGPKIAALLSEHSITNFRQLADADVQELDRILDQARLAFADPSSWPEQANLADLQEWDALGELQSSLKGGRKAA